jgi:hypothetical protein
MRFSFALLDCDYYPHNLILFSNFFISNYLLTKSLVLNLGLVVLTNLLTIRSCVLSSDTNHAARGTFRKPSACPS